MTPRDRILMTLRHERPDRPPTDGWFHAVIMQRLKEHYATTEWADVLCHLGVEGWNPTHLAVAFPEFEREAHARPGGRDGPRAIWLDERTYRDAWGVTNRFGEGDWYEERVAGPLDDALSVEDIEAYAFPEADRVEVPQDYAAGIARAKRNDCFTSGIIPNPYRQAWTLRGMDNVLMDYLINPEMLNRLYDKLYALYQGMAVRMVEAGVDMISIIGDIAMQDRIIMGPDAWRRVDKPRLTALMDACRAVNPDIYFFVHSDGNILDVMDDLVEMGFDVINPIQPECMDPVEVKCRWGNRITLHGGVSLQRTLPNGTPDEVRAEVEELIRNCGYDGGLVVFPSNVIQPDTPVENVVACFHAARDFRW
jgi:uroporphyrinogen decarboxylase